jgi:hypothetical protein
MPIPQPVNGLRFVVPDRLLYSLTAILLAGLLLYVVLWSPNFNAEVPGGDYLDFYMAGRILRNGNPDRFYDFDYQLEFQNDPGQMAFSANAPLSALYIYPPFFAWFCLLFADLPFREGAQVWALLMTACLVASVWLTSRNLGLCSRRFCYILLASLFFTPTLLGIYSCQNAPLSLLILSATFFLLRRGRPLAAGAMFALLAFKPQLTVVIAGVMLWKKQWRFLGGALLVGLILVGASLAVSPSATLAYLRLGPTLSQWIDLPNLPLAEMSSWRGFWRLLLAGQSHQRSELVSTLCSLVTLLIMAWALRGRLFGTGNDFSYAFSLLVPTTVLISPHLLAYDLTLLLLPMTITLYARPLPLDRARDPVWLATAALYFAATVSRWLAFAYGLQVVAPTMFVYIIVVWWMMRPKAEEPAPVTRVIVAA